MSDIDNLSKVSQDTFQKCWIIKNDRLIEKLSVEKIAGPKDATLGYFWQI
jgi:Holliday junction resolvase RusA-like endonuclease